MSNYRAEATNVSFRRHPAKRPEVQWVVRGDAQYKGFGKFARFTGDREECEAVAVALNGVASRRSRT